MTGSSFQNERARRFRRALVFLVIASIVRDLQNAPSPAARRLRLLRGHPLSGDGEGVHGREE
jgi:hypothetical protein